jgi:hypothetical protein
MFSYLILCFTCDFHMKSAFISHNLFFRGSFRCFPPRLFPLVPVTPCPAKDLYPFVMIKDNISMAFQPSKSVMWSSCRMSACLMRCLTKLCSAELWQNFPVKSLDFPFVDCREALQTVLRVCLCEFLLPQVHGIGLEGKSL